MRAKAKQYAMALFLELKDKEQKDFPPVLDSFFQVLKNDNSISQVEKIIFYFNSLWIKEFSLVEAEIVSANSLEGDIREMVVTYLKKMSKAEGVKIEEKEKKDIIGGLIVKYNDKIIDASLKNKINMLKNSLIK
jgi:F-type H+-transporting ATPase subunit delta